MWVTLFKISERLHLKYCTSCGVKVDIGDGDSNLFLSWLPCQPFPYAKVVASPIFCHQISSGLHWRHCASRGQCCHAGQGSRLQETGRRPWAKQALEQIPQNNCLPASCFWFWVPEGPPWINLWPISPASWLPPEPIQALCANWGGRRQGGRVSKLESGTVAIFLFAQNYSGAGSTVDICVTT